MNNLKALKREKLTSGSNNKLRANGFIPAILYGGKDPNQNISVSKKELSNLRNQINKLDEKLFSMIFKRMNIAKKIGEIKVQHNIEITNSDRENELIKHILGLPDNSLDQDEIESIYKLLFSISKKRQNYNK